MLKAVLFDMDGVIVDTEPLHYKAYFGMFNEVGAQVSDEMYMTFKGKSTYEVCEKVCSHFNLNQNPHNLIKIKRRIFKELFFKDSGLELIDGVLEIIKDYHENGLKLVLASSASMLTIDNVFEKFNLNQYFSAKFSGAELEKSKPHPEIFIKAANSTGYSNSECVVIEDSTNGILAANAANIFCVGYKSEHSQDQDYSKANHVINDFKEISYQSLKNILN